NASPTITVNSSSSRIVNLNMGGAPPTSSVSRDRSNPSNLISAGRRLTLAGRRVSPPRKIAPAGAPCSVGGFFVRRIDFLGSPFTLLPPGRLQDHFCPAFGPWSGDHACASSPC